MKEAAKRLLRIRRLETWNYRGRKIAKVVPSVIAGDTYGRWDVRENKKLEIEVV